MKETINKASFVSQGHQNANATALQLALASLREYRKRDPDFEKAIDKFVQGEMTIEDSLEGMVCIGHIVDGELEEIGPTERKLWGDPRS